MSKLFIRDLNSNEYEYLLNTDNKGLTINIGRIATNDIILEDAKVSRNHARIRMGDNSEFVIEDLNSSNGILVNGRRTTMKLLEDRDEIRIGDNFITFSEKDVVNEFINDIKDLGNKKEIKDIEGNNINISGKLNLLGSNMIKFAKVVKDKNIDHDAIYNQILKYIKFVKNIKDGYSSFEKEYKTLYSLNRISFAIGNIIETKDFFTASLDIITNLLNAQRGFIMFFNEETSKFEVKVARKMDEEIKNIDSFSHKIVENVFEGNEVMVVNSPQNDSRFSDGKSVFEYKIKSAIAAPVKFKDKNVGVIYIDKQIDDGGFQPRDQRFFESYVAYCSLSYERVKLFSELEDSYLASIKVLANVLDAKDPYTHGHSERVMEYSIAIAIALGLNEKDVKNIEFGALLHDIGKVGVDISILNKPGRLTDEEFDTIKTHPSQGFDIIKPIKFLQDKFAAIKYHHERWDGTGYPDGLKEENIPLEARIVAVADTFDAMTSTRSYRKALEKDVAIQEIEKCAGTQFDPRIVDAFMKVVNKENVTQVWNKGQEVQKRLNV